MDGIYSKTPDMTESQRPASISMGMVDEKDVTRMDAAAVFLNGVDAPPVLSAKEERKLKIKVDLIMIPMLLITATLGAVDKVALSTASIYGLSTDNHLVGQQYSWLGSILSLGALVGMFPSSALLHKCPDSGKYIACCSIGWSVMALLMPACHNWAGLMCVRFFMGTFEAIIVPGISLILAGWYKKNEQPPRNAIVFAAFSSVVNGFLAWLVGVFPAGALAKWQYLYLMVGSISMAWSLFVLWFLPGTPMTAKFLTKDEKIFWITRMAGNKTGMVNKVWKWDQAKEAVLDPRTWIIFLLNIAINIPNGGLTTFNAIIIKNLGFTSKQSSLLSMPTGIMSTLSAFIFSTLAARWHNRRSATLMLACCVPIIGTIILYTVPRSHVAPEMVGLYLVYTYFGPYVVGISLAQANTAGHTKKNVSFAILYIGYAVGNLIGPQTFRASQAPAYTGGVVAMLVCYCVCIALAAAYWFVCAAQNKRNHVLQEDDGDVDILDNFNDLSDNKQVGFRYTT